MKYWGRVATLTAGEAAEDVRLRAVPVVVSFVAQGIIGVVLFGLAGLAGANIPLRILSALAPFPSFPILFAYRLATVPATLAGASARQALEDADAREAAEAALAAKIETLTGEIENLKSRYRPRGAPTRSFKEAWRLAALLRP
jgi:hypothetical protein